MRLQRARLIKPTKRRGFWYLVRRVPSTVKAWDDRTFASLSTGIRVIDDPRAIVAKQSVNRLNADLERYWQECRQGADGRALQRYQQAIENARSAGFEYRSTAKLVTGPLLDILQRVEAVSANPAHRPLSDAILGGAGERQMKVSSLLDEYADLCKAQLTGKSERQRTKWRAPKQNALNVFIDAIGGDRLLSALTRADTMTFRLHWQDRATKGDVQIDTCNKNIGHLAVMFNEVNMMLQLGLPELFKDLRIAGARTRQRVAFDPEMVQSKILADNMFDELNDQARRILYLVADTGLRLSEACNLTPARIKLTAAVPHVQVRPDDRELKTTQSARDVPLVGVALAAMQHHPDGFPRYLDNADALSALVNKALDARGLCPLEGQSLYSLRHTFEDRLTAVEAPEKVVAALMGHKWHRPRYGAGPSLEQKQRWLKRIAFKPPRSV